MKKLITILIFIIFTIPASAQINITGRILAELDSLPIENAHCELNLNDTLLSETLSDPNGNFTISAKTSGNYSIKFSKSGFTDAGVLLTNLKSDINIGDVFMSSATELDEVTVTAESHKISGDKIIITPGEFDVRSSVKAPELLSKLGIPGLYYSVLNSSITINDEAPVILIDGVPATQKQLQSIKASDVLNVEFSNNVPLNFRSRGSSILRIKLKQRNDGGSFSVTSINGLSGKNLDPNIYLDYHKGPSKFTAGYYFSYRHNDKTTDDLKTEYTNPALKVNIDEHLDNPFIYRNHSAYFSYDLNPDESLTFSANLQLYAHNNLKKTFGIIDDSMLGKYTSSIRQHGNTLSPTLDLFFSKSFGKKNLLQINMTGKFNTDDYESYNLFRGDDFEQRYDISTLGRRMSLMTSLFYLHNFSQKTSLSFSYENMLSKNRNNYRIEDRNVDFSENNNYIYAQFDQGFGNFWLNVSTGIRMDKINDGGIKRSFVNNNSSLRLQWNINEKMYLMMGLSYDPSIFSPSLVVEIPQQTNMYLITTGNPDIKRSQTFLQYLNFGYYTDINTCRIGGNFHFDHPGIYNPIMYSVTYDADKNAYVSKPVNGHSSNNYNTYLSVFCSNLFKMFGIQGRIQYRHFFINDGNWKNTYNCWGGDISVSWQYKKWLVAYGKTFPLKYIDGYNFYTSEENGDYLMVRFRPDNHWALSASWIYILSKKGWVYDTQTISPQYQTSRHREIHNNCNWVRLNVTYDLDFGTQAKQSRQRRMLQNVDNTTTVTKFSY